MKNLTLPGSKSITNRDLILAALHSGKTTLSGALLSDDTKHMMNALRDLGIEITTEGDDITVVGGKEKISSDGLNIFLGQSGTSIRFLVGLAAVLEKGSVTFYGDERLNERPLKALIEGIRQLGLKVDCGDGGLPPVTIHGGIIKNNSVKMDGTVSSQFFTALLNVSGYIEGGLEIEVEGDLVSKPYIDMTLHELSKFGVEVENDDYKKFIVSPLSPTLSLQGMSEDSKDTKYPTISELKQSRKGEEQGGSNDSFSPGGKDAQRADRGLIIEGDASALSYIANYIVLHGGRLEVTNLGSDSKQGDYKYLEILKKYFGLDYTSNGQTTVLKAGGLQRVGNASMYSTEDISFENMPDVSMSFMSLAIFSSEILPLLDCKLLTGKNVRE